MRVTMRVDSVKPDRLGDVLMAHRAATKDSETPRSIEATWSETNNFGAMVSVSGAGYIVESVAMSVEQAAQFTEELEKRLLSERLAS